MNSNGQGKNPRDVTALSFGEEIVQDKLPDCRAPS